MIDVDVAQTFLRVAETSSFQTAAKQLNVTQSTVSARIRTLEDRLGMRLFDRSRTGATLNFHGRTFLRYAAAIVHAWEEGRRVTALGSGTEGRLAIGGEHNLWTRLLALWLLELRAEFPSAELVAEALGTPRLIESLLDASLDLIIVHEEPVRPGIESIHLMDDELVLVTTDPEGKYADRFVDIRWPGDGAADSAQLPEKVEARTRITLGYASINYLIISQGAGYLPRRLVDPYLQAGLLYPAESAPVHSSSVFAAWRTGDSREMITRATAILRDLCAAAEKGELPPPFWRQLGQ